MTKGRTLVVVGYSGRDFDICPLLANDTEQAHTVWLDINRNRLQPGPKNVLTRKRGVFVEGDLVVLLNVLLKQPLSLSTPSPQPIRLDDFDPSLSGEWRLRVLNWIACPKLLSESVADLKDKTELSQSLLGHCGRYRDAVRELESELYTQLGSSDERLRRMIDLARARFIYGQHLRAWKLLDRVGKELLDHSAASDEIRAFAIEARLVMYMRAAQVARALRFKPVLRRIQVESGPLYRRAREILQNSGAWRRLQELQQNAERIGVATPDGLPLPARRGYPSLGLVSMDVIMRRDWIRSGHWRLTPEKQEAALEYIAKAEHYGWHHEAWKLNWIVLCRGSGDKMQNFYSWMEHFWATQYPPFARILQLFLNLVPTGAEEKFEEDHYWS